MSHPARARQHEMAEKELKELKRQIALNQYDVDAGAVAGAIISKLRLVKQGRLAIDGEPSGQTRPAAERRRPAN
jgi:hypothetical protein